VRSRADIFITHDIDEAVQLADRVLVMSRWPANVQEVVEIDLPRPRDLDSPAYPEGRVRIFRTMGTSPLGDEVSTWSRAGDPAPRSPSRNEGRIRDRIMIGCTRKADALPSALRPVSRP
jgi:hypothetical protein